MLNFLGMSTKLAGIMSSECCDSDQDKFLIKGMSIDNLKNAIVNSEHDKSWTKTVGKIIQVRKILSIEDCKSDQEKRLFLKNNKIPYVFGVVELFDETKHVEAQSIAAIIEFHKSGDKGELPVFFSIEVEPVSVSQNKVYQLSVARRVALVRAPANKACLCEVYEEPLYNAVKSEKEEIMSKSKQEEVDDKLEKVIGELISQVKTFSKSLEAGYAMAPIGTNTQGAALQKKEGPAHVVHIPDETTDKVHEESTPVIHVPEHMNDDDKKKLRELVKKFVQSSKLVSKV